MFSTAEAILCGSYTPLGQVQIGPLDSLGGQLAEYQIPAGIISTLKLADLAVTVDKLAASSVNDSKVAGGAGIIESKLNLDYATSALNTLIATNIADIVTNVTGISVNVTDIATNLALILLREEFANKDVASGYLGLDAGAKVPLAKLNPLTNTEIDASAGIVESKLNLDFSTASLNTDIQTRVTSAQAVAAVEAETPLNPVRVHITPPSGGNALEVEAGDLDVNIFEILRAGAKEYGYYLKYIGTGSSDANYLELWSHNTTLADELLMRFHQSTQEIEIPGALICGSTVDGVDVSAEPARISTEIDSDISTHAGLPNVHHAQSHDIASHSDITFTGAQLEDAALHAATWVPCAYVTNDLMEVWDESTAMLSNPSTNNQWLLWNLNLPPVKGTLKLWVTGVRVGLFDADANNCVSEMLVYGVKYNGATSLTVTDRTVDKNSQGLHEYVIANNDCSTYENVAVKFQVELANVGALDISSVALLCYYA